MAGKIKSKATEALRTLYVANMGAKISVYGHQRGMAIIIRDAATAEVFHEFLNERFPVVRDEADDDRAPPLTDKGHAYLAKEQRLVAPKDIIMCPHIPLSMGAIFVPKGTVCGRCEAEKKEVGDADAG